jgi:hypothetical protein
MQKCKRGGRVMLSGLHLAIPIRYFVYPIDWVVIKREGLYAEM